MLRLGDIMTHLRLVLRMGKVTGTDLVGAHRAGRLSQQDWAEMIRFCQGCAWAKDCPEWMDRHESIAGAPCTCPNRTRFAALKAGQMEDA